MPSNAYHVHIFYSSEDEGYIAIVPRLKGCTAFGPTLEEAAREVQIAIDLWLAAAREAGWSIPVPEKKAVSRRVLLKKKPGTAASKTRNTFRESRATPAVRVLRRIPPARKKIAAK